MTGKRNGAPPMTEAVRDLISILPPDVARWAGVAGLALGAALWLAGSRFGQGLVTLCGVALGAYVGKQVPGWMGWGIDPMGTCFGGALVAGVSGYLHHRMWEGLGLGLLLASWVALASWATLVAPAGYALTWPAAAGPTGDWVARAGALWTALPPDLRTAACLTGGALLAGWVLAMAWPRMGATAFYSLLGVTLLAAAASAHGRMPATPETVHVIVAAAMAAIGIMVQTWLGPRRAAVSVAATDDDPRRRQPPQAPAAAAASGEPAVA